MLLNVAEYIGIIAFSASGYYIGRDILINKVPYVLHGGFYGIIALGLGCATYSLHALGWLNTFSLIVLFLIGVTLRMVAYVKEWHLPKE